MSGELIRWIGVSGCCFILGMNAAFLIRVQNTVWRWFIAGKGLITTYVVLDIWFDEFHWIIGFALIGIVVTSFSQIKMWISGEILFKRGTR